MLNNKTKNKYFINFIQDYFKSLQGFSLVENYHLHTFLVAKEAGYNKLITIIKGGEDILRSDPNLKVLQEKYNINLKIIPYKNIFNFIYQILKYSLKFSCSTFYTNGHNLYMYMCIVLPKIFSFGFSKNIFMAHTQPIRGGLGKAKLKQFIQDKIIFRFFIDRIRLNNLTEEKFLISRGVKKDKLFVAPLVVDDKLFSRTRNIAERKDLLYFGQLTKKKNVTNILKAFKQVLRQEKYKNLKLHIIGKVGTDYNLEKDIQDLSLENNIIKYGFVPLKELNEKLNQTLIYLNDSEDEGQCVAVFEAALSGNALCLPNIMSFREVFQDYSEIHKQGNVEDLTRNIIDYLENPIKIENDNEKAIQMIKENYNDKIVSEKMKELFIF